MRYSYSIVIRTLGNSGEKYSQLLECVKRQTIRPEEVIVAIPDGYDLDFQLGWETIIRSPKGMVSQRVAGINACTSDYMLVLDDDVIFPDDFVEKLFLHLSMSHLDCVLTFGGGWNHATDTITPNKKEKIISFLRRYRCAFTGQFFISNRQSDYFDAVTVTAGHITYERCSDKLCQLGCFQCFFMDTKKAKSVNFGEEIWLEQGSISSYAAYDDAVFFYKAFLQGTKIAYTNLSDYFHLDAAAGRVAKSRLDSKRIRLYTIAKNRTVFWFKFLLMESDSFKRKIMVLFGGLYAFVNYTLYSIVVNFNPKYWKAIVALFRGYWDALAIIRERKR